MTVTSKRMRAAIFFGLFLLMLLLMFFFWAASVKEAGRIVSEAAVEATDNDTADNIGVTPLVTDGQLVDASNQTRPSGSAVEATASDPDADPISQEQTSPRAALYEEADLELLRRELEADINDKMSERELRRQALRSPIGASHVSFSNNPDASAQADPADPPRTAVTAPLTPLPSPAPSLRLADIGQPTGLAANPGQPIRIAGQPQGNTAPTALAGPQAATDSGYSPHRPAPARSPYEIKKGTVIPGILATGINSDIPGYVSGVVRLDVFDTVMGRFLLIPAGSRIFGRYDPDTAYGQRRLNVAWTHLTFPDGDTLVLEGQQATDGTGQSGFADQRRGHFLATLAGNLLYTIINIGETAVQARLEEAITQRPPEPEGLAASIGQIGSSLGGGNRNSAAAIFNRQQSQLKPTLVIRPGYLFNILVARDLIMEPRG